MALQGGYNKVQAGMQGVIVTTGSCNLGWVGRQSVDALSTIYDDAKDPSALMTPMPPPPPPGAATTPAATSSVAGAAAEGTTNGLPIEENPSATETDTSSSSGAAASTTPVASADDAAPSDAPDAGAASADGATDAAGSDDDEAGLSIEAELAAELAELDPPRAPKGSRGPNDKGKGEQRPKPRFRFIETGCRGVIFVACRKDVAPVALVSALYEDVIESGESRCHLAARMMPTTHSCKANLKEITRTAEHMLNSRFLREGAPSVAYSVQCRTRNTSLVNKREVSDAINAQVLASPSGHTYSIDDPEYVILIEIMKNLCFMGVLPHWNRYAKYNIANVTPTEDSDPRKRSAGDADPDDETGESGRPTKVPHVDQATNPPTESIFSSEYERELAAVRSRSLAAIAARSGK
jgi:tRNA(Ser,Leu) C12 N-acetylase TAN1